MCLLFLVTGLMCRCKELGAFCAGWKCTVRVSRRQRSGHEDAAVLCAGWASHLVAGSQVILQRKAEVSVSISASLRAKGKVTSLQGNLFPHPPSYFCNGLSSKHQPYTGLALAEGRGCDCAVLLVLLQKCKGLVSSYSGKHLSTSQSKSVFNQLIHFICFFPSLT